MTGVAMVTREMEAILRVLAMRRDGMRKVEVLLTLSNNIITHLLIKGIESTLYRVYQL